LNQSSTGDQASHQAQVRQEAGSNVSPSALASDEADALPLFPGDLGPRKAQHIKPARSKD
jgi:hypothetical protein